MQRVWKLIIIISVFFPSCEKSPIPDCFKNTGPVVMEERGVDEFNSILLRHNINLHLRQASTNKIKVEAGQNLMNKIKTIVNENGQLEIRNDNACNWVRSYDIPIDVYLDFVKLDSIEYRSIGDLTSINTLVLDSLRLDVLEGAGRISFEVDVSVLYCGFAYGTADIFLSGNCEISYVYSAAYGLIDNRDLKSKFVYANNKSSNDMFLQATTELAVTIENIGNVYYTGNPPTVSFNQIGSGKLINLE